MQDFLLFYVNIKKTNNFFFNLYMLLHITVTILMCSALCERNFISTNATNWKLFEDKYRNCLHIDLSILNIEEEVANNIRTE